MSYFCHSCQNQTEVIAANYLACEQCLSDFVEEIEPVQENRTWSDEDDTLASLWNSVFRHGLNNSPLPGSFPQDDNDELTAAVASGDEEFNYAFGVYQQDDGDDDDNGENGDNNRYFFNDYQEHLDEPDSPWPVNHNNQEDDSNDEYYQDVDSSDDEDGFQSVDTTGYISARGGVDHDDGGNEYSSESSSDNDDDDDEYEDGYEHHHYESGLVDYSYDTDEEGQVDEEEDDDDERVGLGQLVREALIDDVDDIYHERPDFITDVNEYDDPPEYHGSGISLDPAYHLSTLLRMIQEQHEAAFTDSSNWEMEGSREVQSASEDTIAALPRHRLNPGDAAAQSECSICLNTLGTRVELINLPCMHGFHGTCIEQWLQVNASCPVCRCPCSS
ncbi:hypothetical protein BDA99DRAFT_521763 [Phascolomyces articulosus]|uniref:RING-type domain-containing protein n=1 Tax=Phascolomyces articulosus TaxID=60185 RepID=A0AAD5PA55_9FUNG|nr:hypothetical protein BDA99DRAFT_521763 [Phascolomyces articulosus]